MDLQRLRERCRVSAAAEQQKCGRGWAARCENATTSRCRCRCGGTQHGVAHRAAATMMSEDDRVDDRGRRWECDRCGYIVITSAADICPICGGSMWGLEACGCELHCPVCARWALIDRSGIVGV